MAGIDRYGSHAATLDAHTYNMQQKLKIGNYLIPFYTVSASATLAMVADTLYLTPFFVARAMTIDRLAIQVTTAGAAGKIARLGIYKNSTNIYPGDLVIDAGTVAVDAIAVVAATINQVLTKGLYFMAAVSDGTPEVRRWVPSFSPMGTFSTFFENIVEVYTKAAVGSGALANPCISGGIETYAKAILVTPRLLSLD